MERRAAIHIQIQAGDIIGVIGCQPDDHASDILRLPIRLEGTIIRMAVRAFSDPP
jgi:hypothetical protein